jgi:hypothetical protein
MYNNMRLPSHLNSDKNESIIGAMYPTATDGPYRLLHRRHYFYGRPHRYADAGSRYSQW